MQRNNLGLDLSFQETNHKITRAFGVQFCDQRCINIFFYIEIRSFRVELTIMVCVLDEIALNKAFRNFHCLQIAMVFITIAPLPTMLLGYDYEIKDPFLQYVVP